MKSSGKGVRPRSGARHFLVVDGYNILAVGNPQGLRGIEDLEAARDELCNRLAGYRAYYGEDVAVVFDAYRTPNPATDFDLSGIRVVFTDTGETADHRIERLVYELRDTYKEITVATSDSAEQQTAFGGGALRISASELIRRLTLAERRIHNETEKLGKQGNRVIDSIRQDVATILEKWRRQ